MERAEIAPVEEMIVTVRGQRVILADDLARVYGVETRVLNQAVRRNLEKFPQDFMFEITRDEARSVQRLRSQSVILNGEALSSRGKHRKYLPYAFTEQGVAMLSSVLRSPRAVAVNVEIMRAFVRMRSLLQSQEDLWRKITALEKKYDRQFRSVFDAIRELMQPPAPTKRPIGFVAPAAPGKERKGRRKPQ